MLIAPAPALDLSAREEWRAHWPVVAAALVGTMLCTVAVYSTGVMIAPLEQEFGWSRTQISSGPSILAVMGFIMAPLIGMAIDRFGPRRIALGCAFFYCAAMAMLGLVTADIRTWWGAWLITSLVSTALGPTVWSAGVTSLFSKSRGFALAVALCGSGIGAAVIPSTANLLLEHYGWRHAYMLLGLLCAIVLSPVLFFFSSARDKGIAQTTERRSSSAAVMTDGRVWPLIGSARFIKLALAAVAIVVVSLGMTTNLVPILVSEGMTQGQAAAMSGFIGLGGVVGRLSCGMLLDRINGSLVGGTIVLMPVFSGVLLIAFPGSVPVAAVAVLMIGLALGAELDTVAYLTSRYFGLTRFGVLFGTIAGLLTLAAGVGPLAVSYVYDIQHSYRPVLWAIIPICLLSSILFLSLGPYPKEMGTDEP